MLLSFSINKISWRQGYFFCIFRLILVILNPCQYLSVVFCLGMHLV